jgi:hypothetical protein
MGSMLALKMSFFERENIKNQKNGVGRSRTRNLLVEGDNNTS